MNKLWLVVLISILANVCFSQDIKSLKAVYEKESRTIELAAQSQNKEALNQYKKALDTRLADLKQRGDLKTFLLVEAEQKRFIEEQTITLNVPSVLDSVVQAYQKFVAETEIERNRQKAVLIKRYTAALDNLIKQLMQGNKIEDATAVQAEKDRVAFELADAESKIPVVTNSVSRVVVETRPARPSRRLMIPKEAVKFNGHHYLFVGEKKTWHEAKKACEAMGGHLVTISGEAENKFLASITGGHRVWIGMYRDKSKTITMVWVDGTPLKFTAWFRGEPNNLGGVEDYVDYLVWQGNPIWCDRADSFDLIGGYVCEWDY